MNTKEMIERSRNRLHDIFEYGRSKREEEDEYTRNHIVERHLNKNVKYLVSRNLRKASSFYAHDEEDLFGYLAGLLETEKALREISEWCLYESTDQLEIVLDAEDYAGVQAKTYIMSKDKLVDAKYVHVIFTRDLGLFFTIDTIFPSCSAKKGG